MNNERCDYQKEMLGKLASSTQLLLADAHKKGAKRTHAKGLLHERLNEIATKWKEALENIQIVIDAPCSCDFCNEAAKHDDEEVPF